MRKFWLQGQGGTVIPKSPKGRPEVSDHGFFINDRIKAREVRLITDDGSNIGLVSLDQALRMAQQKGLDLVQISENAAQVVVKIMDFGKFLYERKKQLNDAKKNQKVIQIKELKLRPRIEEGDYKIRIKQAGEFFSDGKRVKFTLQFRGREIPMMDKLGTALFERIEKDLATLDLGAIVSEKDSKGGQLWSKIFYLKEK